MTYVEDNVDAAQLHGKLYHDAHHQLPAQVARTEQLAQAVAALHGARAHARLRTDIVHVQRDRRGTVQVGEHLCHGWPRSTDLLVSSAGGVAAAWVRGRQFETILHGLP